MKKTIFSGGFLFVALTVLLNVPVNKGQAGTEKKMTIFQITWEDNNIEGELYVNGFLITSFHGSQSFGGQPLAPYLIGENAVWAEVRKKDTTQPGQLSIDISTMTEGEIAATNEPGNVVSMEIKDADLKPATTIKVSKNFSSTLNFSAHLRPTGTVGGKEAIEYAKAIYELFKAKKTDDLMKEFEVKIGDFSAAYPGHDFKKEFRSVLKEMFKGKLAPIDLNQLRAKKAGPDNKLWQVLEGKKELIRITSPDGSQNDMAVYVGVVDGKLKVVR